MICENLSKSLIVPAKSLPMGLVAEYDFDFLEIEPLIYPEVVYHTRNYSYSSDRLTKLYYHFNIARKKITHFEDLYLPDAFFAVFMLYFYSFSDLMEGRFSYVCRICKTENAETINAREIKFKKQLNKNQYVKIPYVALENEEYVVKYDTHVFEYPKIKNMLKKMNKMYSIKRKRIYDFDVNLLIISHVDYEKNEQFIEDYLMSLNRYKAWILLHFLDQFSDFVEPIQRTCKACKSVNHIDINNGILDDFMVPSFKEEDLVQLKIFLNSKGFENADFYTVDFLKKIADKLVEMEEKESKENRTVYSFDRTTGITIT